MTGIGYKRNRGEMMIKVSKQAWRLAMLGMVFPMAQAGAAETESLGQLTVTSTRVDKNLLKVPAAISVVDQDDIQFGRQQLGLDEGLAKIPGLFMLDRYNFAQDLRISIRGFGSRSSFGIRGIKIYSDGIPSTLPDGQGGVDDIDLGSLRRAEVIRGPVSSLYGAASGGVINLFTEDGPETPFYEGRFTYGSYEFAKTQLKTGGQAGKLNYLINASHMRLDGYRGHSQVEHMQVNSKFRYDIDAGSDLTVVVNAVDSPLAQDAGGLKLSEVSANRRQGRARNITFDAGESVKQQKLGLVYTRAFSQMHRIKLRNYYVWRDFSNKLPFSGSVASSNGGAVQFDRFFYGGGADYTYSDSFFGHANRLIIGFDIDVQDDDRRRFVNNNGVLGALSLDQNEKVTSAGYFVRNEFSLLDQLELTLGARYDDISFEVNDHFLANTTGDDSSQVDFNELSPMGGLLWSPVESLNLYTNVSTSFETPTTTEFTNPGGGGFNPALKPQTATNYELGAKGLVDTHYGSIRYDLAVFHIDSKDELIGRDVNGRGFFVNAGSTNRNGVETSFTYQPSFIRGLTWTSSYTYSDFTFDQFRSNDTAVCSLTGGICDGKDIPGVPRHQFYTELSYVHPSGWYWSWDLLHVGRFFADNENQVAISAYQVANLRLGYTGHKGDVEFTPFIGINNLFGQEYFGNVRLNASFGRYYEPAPGRNIFAGITLRYMP